MNRKVREEYLSLLRCALWDSDLPPAPSHTPKLLQLANAHVTLPLITDVFQRAGYPLSPENREKMEEILSKATRLNQELDREVTAILQEWAAEGIRGVLLKGPGLARNYPRPGLRGCGDLDLWVPDRDYRRACDLLLKREKALGKIRTLDKGEKHMSVYRGLIIVEVHRRLLVMPEYAQDILWQGMEKEGLSKDLAPVDIDGVTVFTPEPTFNALFVFAHAWEHFRGSGVGLRQLSDWTLFLHARARSLDRKRLGAWLEALQLMKPWQVFGALAVHGLGLPAEEMPFYDARYRRRGACLLRMILREGNFGRNRPARKNRIERSAFVNSLHTALSLPVRAVRLLPVFPALAYSILRNGLTDGLRKLFKGR